MRLPGEKFVLLTYNLCQGSSVLYFMCGIVLLEKFERKTALVELKAFCNILGIAQVF